MTDDPRPITRWTVKALTRQCLLELDEKYDLVYVSYDDKFTPEQVAMIVRGDFESLWESTEEWESDTRYLSALEDVHQLGRDIAQRWERTFGIDSDELFNEWESDTDETDTVRYAIEERDEGTWPQQLASNTPRVLMRHVLRDEDHSIYGGSWPDLTATDVLTWLREGAEEGTVVKRNTHNVEVIRSVLAEAFHTEAYLMGMLVYAIDPGELLNVPDDALIDIVDPHLYLGNYYQGDGWCSDKPLRGTFRVKRSDLRTDKDAPGYGWDEVAGVVTSYYEAEIKVVGA